MKNDISCFLAKFDKISILLKCIIYFLMRNYQELQLPLDFA